MNTPSQFPRCVLATAGYMLAATGEVPMAADSWHSARRAPPRIRDRLSVAIRIPPLAAWWLPLIPAGDDLMSSHPHRRDFRRLSLAGSMHEAGSEQDAS